MKRITAIVSLIILIVFYIIACKKESSLETGNNSGGIAVGSLLDSAGNCQQIIVKGNYQVDNILTDSNYLLIKLNIINRGKFKINSDSSNGFWFSDSGYTISTGIQTVKVKGYGKPLLPIITTKTVGFDSTFCEFTIPF